MRQLIARIKMKIDNLQKLSIISFLLIYFPGKISFPNIIAIIIYMINLTIFELKSILYSVLFLFIVFVGIYYHFSKIKLKNYVAIVFQVIWLIINLRITDFSNLICSITIGIYILLTTIYLYKLRK